MRRIGSLVFALLCIFLFAYIIFTQFNTISTDAKPSVNNFAESSEKPKGERLVVNLTARKRETEIKSEAQYEEWVVVEEIFASDFDEDVPDVIENKPNTESKRKVASQTDQIGIGKFEKDQILLKETKVPEKSDLQIYVPFSALGKIRKLGQESFYDQIDIENDSELVSLKLFVASKSSGIELTSNILKCRKCVIHKIHLDDLAERQTEYFQENPDYFWVLNGQHQNMILSERLYENNEFNNPNVLFMPFGLPLFATEERLITNMSVFVNSDLDNEIAVSVMHNLNYNGFHLIRRVIDNSQMRKNDWITYQNIKTYGEMVNILQSISFSFATSNFEHYLQFGIPVFTFIELAPVGLIKQGENGILCSLNQSAEICVQMIVEFAESWNVEKSKLLKLDSQKYSAEKFGDSLKTLK